MNREIEKFLEQIAADRPELAARAKDLLASSSTAATTEPDARDIVRRLVAAFDRRPTLPVLHVARESPLMRDARAVLASPLPSAPATTGTACSTQHSPKQGDET